jgi:hypothetical protein
MTGLQEQLDAVPVEHVEDLEGLARRPVPEPAVGQHAIDVEQHQPDALRAFQRVALRALQDAALRSLLRAGRCSWHAL